MSTCDLCSFSGPEANRYLALASFMFLVAILYYDYFLTLSMEIDNFWKAQHKVSWTSTLFVLNRYFAVAGQIPIALEYFADMSPQLFHQAFSVATQVTVSVGVVSIATDLITEQFAEMSGQWAVIASRTSGGPRTDYVPTSTCNALLTIRQAADLIAPWGAMLIFDTMIFLLTLCKTIRLLHLAPRTGTLLQIFLRDGIIYFGALVIVNVANIVTFLDYTRGMVSTLTNVMSSVLISRLMLNLRDPGLNELPQHATHSQADPLETSKPHSPLIFARQTRTEGSQANGFFNDTPQLVHLHSMHPRTAY
ncbi:hypothetical protein IEO21_07772 [Rhodonia placenta]|uniref:DUF6533 domain-containing protein n=1 Tax=Rhodonia placenta TaxID=104341 RepID=A0A8H7U001_9APHY|nr:hypothetical protein IEO21_07772 [Postia placenta]